MEDTLPFLGGLSPSSWLNSEIKNSQHGFNCLFFDNL